VVDVLSVKDPGVISVLPRGDGHNVVAVVSVNVEG